MNFFGDPSGAPIDADRLIAAAKTASKSAPWPTSVVVDETPIDGYGENANPGKRSVANAVIACEKKKGVL